MTSLAQQLRDQFPMGARVEYVGEYLPEPWGAGIKPGAQGAVIDTDANVYDDGDGESGPHLVIDLSVQVRLDGHADSVFLDPDELRVLQGVVA